MRSEREIQEELEFWQTKKLSTERTIQEHIQAKRQDLLPAWQALRVQYNEKVRLLKWVLGELGEKEK
jgi:hypothetical protein